MYTKYLKYILIAVIGFGLAACAPKKQVMEEPTAEEVAVSDLQDMEPEPEEVEVIEFSEPEISSSVFLNFENVENVNFEFDKYALTYEAKEIMAENAKIIKDMQYDYDFLIEGHCDERGTIEYNIALGQKRANTVRNYYIQLGISPDSVTTISYGKEQPMCEDATESCWGENRRAETKRRKK
jgi:peptidoglycan-associated lipoprotein